MLNKTPLQTCALQQAVGTGSSKSSSKQSTSADGLKATCGAQQQVARLSYQLLNTLCALLCPCAAGFVARPPRRQLAALGPRLQCCCRGEPINSYTTAKALTSYTQLRTGCIQSHISRASISPVEEHAAVEALNSYAGWPNRQHLQHWQHCMCQTCLGRTAVTIAFCSR